MGTENYHRILLSSWKKIADYLDCGIRTCRRWEKEYGLPVHRIEGADKSPVFAFKEELDAWLKQKLNNRVTSKKRYRVPNILLRQGLIVVLLLCAVAFIFLLFSISLKRPGPVEWREANIVVSDPSAEKLTVLSSVGQKAFTTMLTAKPFKSLRAVMDDVDFDGVLEIIALMNICVNKKKRKGNEGIQSYNRSENQKPESRIYPIILRKEKTYDWRRLAKSIVESNADYLVGSGNVLSLAIGDLDAIPGKEIVITLDGKLAVFTFDRIHDQLRLLAVREEIIDGVDLNLWNVALVRSNASGKEQIFISAYLKGREEISFLLILEMWDNWPVLKRVVPSDTYTASNPLCIGNVIEGGDREIISARARRRGDWENAYILGWDQKGDQLFDFQLNGPQLTRYFPHRIPRIAVGDLTPHPGDEIVVITNLRNQPSELVVYRIEDLSLIELSRHRLDQFGCGIHRVIIANLDADIANEIFIEGSCSSDPKSPPNFFFEVFDYDGSLLSFWRKEIKLKYIRDVSVSGMTQN
jgi:hypothetical protein